MDLRAMRVAMVKRMLMIWLVVLVRLKFGECEICT
jgi:hypothetical protein